MEDRLTEPSRISVDYNFLLMIWQISDHIWDITNSWSNMYYIRLCIVQPDMYLQGKAAAIAYFHTSIAAIHVHKYTILFSCRSPRGTVTTNHGIRAVTVVSQVGAKLTTITNIPQLLTIVYQHYCALQTILASTGKTAIIINMCKQERLEQPSMAMEPCWSDFSRWLIVIIHTDIFIKLMHNVHKIILYYNQQ